MQKTIYIPIDTTLDNVVEVNKLIKRGDTLTLIIKVFTNAVLSDLNGQTIDLILKKADNTIIENTITTVANGIITAILTEQATLVEGIVSGEVQIYNSTSHLTTNTFIFNVDASIADDVLAKSENEIETLVDLKTVIDNNNTIISDYVTNITQIAGTAESVQALANTKVYIDSNLVDLQQANAEATVNIENETTKNNEATQNIADLTTLNSNADALNIDLERNITIGTILNDDIESNVVTGNALKSGLETDITNGTTLKTNLDASISTGNTLKTDIGAENVRAEANITAMEGFGDVTILTQTVADHTDELTNARNGEIDLDARLEADKIELSNKIGDLTTSTNTDKTSVVNITNEINESLSEIMKQYKGFATVNSNYSATTPIIDLITAMADNSFLVAETGTNSAGVYPTNQGSVRIFKISISRNMIEIANYTGAKWFASYHPSYGFSGWEQSANASNHQYSSRKYFDNLNITDANMSATDFANNIATLYTALGAFTHYSIYAYASNYPNLSASIAKKLTDDLGVTFTSAGGFVLEMTCNANTAIPNKIFIYPNGSTRIFYISLDSGISVAREVATTDQVDILWSGTVHTGTLTLTKDISQYDKLIILVNGLIGSVWYNRTTVLDTYPTTISSPAYVSFYEVDNTVIKMDITGTTATINGTLVGYVKRITGIKRGV